MHNALATQHNFYQSEHLPQECCLKNSLAQADPMIEQWLQERLDVADEIDLIAKFAKQCSRAIRYFNMTTKNLSIETAYSSQVSQMFSAPDRALNVLDSELWSRLLNHSQLLSAMTSKKRKEWDSLVKEGDVPPFTRENVLPTVRTLLEEQGLYFAERVATVFHALSPDHITNSPAGFGKRMIMKGLFSRDRGRYESYSNSSSSISPLDDLRVIIATLTGRATLRSERALTYKVIDRLTSRLKFGEWVSLDGGSIRIKLFKVGTVHVEVHQDIAFKLNDILSMIYPAAIPETFRRAGTRSASMPQFDVPVDNALLSLSAISVLMDYRRFDFRNKELRELQEKFKGFDSLYVFSASESSDEAGVRHALQAIGGKHIELDYWAFDYNPANAIAHICETGSLPNKKNFQYYPSSGEVGEHAADILRAHIKVDGAQLLEPSVGQGHLALRIPEAVWTCLELSPTNAAVTRSKGLSVMEQDFLAWAKTTGKRFDGVLMNPPFKSNQAYCHVVQAAELLKQGGVLVSIVPVGTQLLSLKERFPGLEQSADFKKAFEGVSVDVCIVTIRN